MKVELTEAEIKYLIYAVTSLTVTGEQAASDLVLMANKLREVLKNPQGVYQKKK